MMSGMKKCPPCHRTGPTRGVSSAGRPRIPVRSASRSTMQRRKTKKMTAGMTFIRAMVR
jgi:hypothetical protein